MADQDNQVDSIDKEYVAIVEEAIKNNLNLDIPNSTLNHAVFLSQKLIRESRTHIKILTGELDSAYYDRVKDDLRDAVTRFCPTKGKIMIIIWEKDAPVNREFQEFVNSNRDTIEIKVANQTDGLSHFLVSDSKRYRLEEPHSKQDLIDENIKGTANFNNPEIASILEQNFDKIWSTITN